MGAEPSHESRLPTGHSPRLRVALDTPAWRGYYGMTPDVRHDHFFVTRFNLAIRDFRERLGLNDDNYESWCEQRVELFLDYTLPAMEQQTHRDFAWLIGFDTAPSESVDGLIARLERLPWVVPIRHDNRPRRDGVFSDAISRHINARSTAPVVSTTRLDADDTVHADFAAVLKREIAKRADVEPPYAISFPLGIQYGSGRAFAYLYESNPFITLVEPRTGDPLKTVFDFAHYEVKQRFTLFCSFPRHPMWAQVLHSINVANELKPGLPELVLDGDLRRQLSLP